MEKIDEELAYLKDDINNNGYFTSAYYKVLDEKNILLIGEVEDLPYNKDNSEIETFEQKDYKNISLPFYHNVTSHLYNDIKIHSYIFTYPDLSNILNGYNSILLNSFSCLFLQSIISNPDVDKSLYLNRKISLNIAELLMKKDTFTVEELYKTFEETFPKLLILSLEDFKKAYKDMLPNDGLITRNMNDILSSLANIPYLNEKYLNLLVDCSRLHNEELIHYLRKIVIRYLKDINLREKILININKINLDYYLDRLLFRDTLARKLQK